MPDMQTTPTRSRKLGLWILIGVVLLIALGWVALHMLAKQRQDMRQWVQDEWNKTIDSATTQPAGLP